ncbi:MAG: hypothetical protein AAF589_01245 [Planctomycetota bacterium]
MKRIAAFIAVLVAAASTASAHFPWLVTDDTGRAVLFFGESLAEREYHLPEAVEKAEVTLLTAGEESKTLAMPVVEEEGLIGRRTAEAVDAGGLLQAKVSYGIYHGTHLNYYVQHTGELKADGQASNADPLPLSAKLTENDQGGLDVLVLWRGQPLKGTEVKLFCDQGHEEGSGKTDEAGRVSFDSAAVEPGTNGLLVGFTENDKSGEINGKEYTSTSHYLTATFTRAGEKKEPEPEPEQTSDLPLLAEPIASFGAATSEGWLYVYSGHTGTAHDHSRENLSQHFTRIRLEGGEAWEALPIETTLQGFALVAHGGCLYRVGGLHPRNAPDEEEQLFSVDEFSRFTPETGEWQKLPPLPEPRSSHDAVVIGDKLYVAGGWTLAGPSSGTWLDTAWVCNLKDAKSGWSAVPSPPFLRRALALSELNGQLVAIGGMDDAPTVSNRVDAFDPDAGKWSQIADFPADGFAAFGVSAWHLDGALYASAGDGVLRRLTRLDGEWEDVCELRSPRFFHRLVPAGEGRLVAIGGASEDGHLPTSEFLTP